MKKLLEPLANAWQGARTHKLRSSLTILGIVIGVAAVIALMSIGRGVQAGILSNIESLGSNLITVTPAMSYERGGVMGVSSMATLTSEDAAAISEQVSQVSAVAPFSSSNQQLVYGSENVNAQVIGVTPEYQAAYNLETAEGAFISEYNYESGAKVAVIGASVAEELFSGVDPVGQKVRMGTSIVTVMGVLESKGSSMMGSTDDAVLIPLSTLQQTISQQRTNTGEHIVSTIAITVSEQGQANYVVGKVTDLLRSRHRLASGEDDDFSIRSMEELVSTITEISGTLTLFLGAIAAISLLVGGIGVMNIMLVSVVERTREIGIRKALGARERDIWGQFLTESALLSFTGGLIGVALGWGASKIIAGVGIMGSEMTTVVSADIVILALAVSVGIGLLFGFLPARRAAQLNPIEALRYE
ncbi:MAG: ABC transporter permease [Dehalococcoidales bacterium]|nr:ABC transporter permease [Dehalococcoidales bacterium]